MYLHEEMGFCNTTHFKVKDLLYIKGVVLFLLFKKNDFIFFMFTKSTMLVLFTYGCALKIEPVHFKS